MLESHKLRPDPSDPCIPAIRFLIIMGVNKRTFPTGSEDHFPGGPGVRLHYLVLSAHSVHLLTASRDRRVSLARRI